MNYLHTHWWKLMENPKSANKKNSYHRNQYEVRTKYRPNFHTGLVRINNVSSFALINKFWIKLLIHTINDPFPKKTTS